MIKSDQLFQLYFDNDELGPLVCPSNKLVTLGELHTRFHEVLELSGIIKYFCSPSQYQYVHHHIHIKDPSRIEVGLIYLEDGSLSTYWFVLLAED